MAEVVPGRESRRDERTRVVGHGKEGRHLGAVQFKLRPYRLLLPPLVRRLGMKRLHINKRDKEITSSVELRIWALKSWRYGQRF
jgi:hypothetical protein